MRLLDNVFYRKRSIGEGTFGQVYMAERKENGEVMALKRIKQPLSQRRFSASIRREIDVLKRMKHPNIVEFFEVVKRQRGSNTNLNSFFMVFEYCPLDLSVVLDNIEEFDIEEDHKKTITHHILKGLHKLHNASYMHCDMKPNNILISKAGIVKLADFGMALPFSNSDELVLPLVNPIVHIAYGPPEILLSATETNDKIDIWGLGCIMAQIYLNNQLLFDKHTEESQLCAISNICGSINKTVMPKCETMRNWGRYTENEEERETILPQGKERQISKIFRSKIPSLAGFNLLDKCLEVDPDKRISAKKALRSRWFVDVKPDIREMITAKFPED